MVLAEDEAENLWSINHSAKIVNYYHYHLTTLNHHYKDASPSRLFSITLKVLQLKKLS